MVPELDAPNTEILGAFAGLRPSRKGGARVAKENILINGSERQCTIIHNYGAGGTGYQAGYGMAVDAVDIAVDVLKTLPGTAPGDFKSLL